MRDGGKRSTIDILRNWHAARVNLEDLVSGLGVRHANRDLSIETARAAQRRVDAVRAIGRSHDDDIPASLQPIHQRQKLSDYSLLHLALDTVAFRCQGIDFVKEDDGRCPL